MAKGTIFSIEEFAINDGPGIRTTLFFKGCPLCCAWCHNPEGISFKPQILKKRDGDEICGEVVDAQQLAAKILKDRAFLEMNDGGVTITGGEPLAQPEFLTELILSLKPLHVAIETSGHTCESIFRRVASIVDLVLFDAKHMNAQEHIKYTGVDNSLILKNLGFLCESDIPFIVRIPLIPGVNDTLSNMQAILDFIGGAKSLVRVEMLRYHKTAGAKYEMTGQIYSPPFNPQAEVNIYNVFEENNIKTIIL